LGTPSTPSTGLGLGKALMGCSVPKPWSHPCLPSSKQSCCRESARHAWLARPRPVSPGQLPPLGRGPQGPAQMIMDSRKQCGPEPWLCLEMPEGGQQGAVAQARFGTPRPPLGSSAEAAAPEEGAVCVSLLPAGLLMVKVACMPPPNKAQREGGYRNVLIPHKGHLG
jgi:hypothetical protein